MKPYKILIFAASLTLFGLLAAGCVQSSAEPPEPDASPPDPSPPDAASPDVSPPGKAESMPPVNQTERERRRITVSNGRFAVDGGSKPIWINGANTPWDNWNDFGGRFNEAWWDGHFADLSENGVNAVRVWVNCNNGQNAVMIDDNGTVSGVSEKHWADLDKLFAAAERHGMYIMATILSFDHFKDENRLSDALKWRAMVQSDDTVDSFIEHYTIPFVNRYKDNPYLWSIDLCNEPDWVHEEDQCGRLAWEDLSRFFARNAAAIHEHSPVLVTVGMAFPKYNADGSGYEGNKVSDAFLQNLYQNENAALDFWSTHYYDWVGEWYGVPFTSKPYGPRSEGGWGLDSSKPAMLGEFSANGCAGATLTENYMDAFENGWQGVMPWTSNGVDDNGGFDQLVPAARHIAETFPEMIFPLR